MFFINGIFWREDDKATLETLPITDPNVKLPRTMKKYMFHGFIGKEKMQQTPEHVTDGCLVDKLGESELFDLKFDGENLSFKAGDLDGSPEILFRFKRDWDGTFVGEWEILDSSGLLIDNDSARCILTELPDSLFTKPD